MCGGLLRLGVARRARLAPNGPRSPSTRTHSRIFWQQARRTLAETCLLDEKRPSIETRLQGHDSPPVQCVSSYLRAPVYIGYRDAEHRVGRAKTGLKLCIFCTVSKSVIIYHSKKPRMWDMPHRYVNCAQRIPIATRCLTGTVSRMLCGVSYAVIARVPAGLYLARPSKKGGGELPTAPNGIEIVQRNQLPGPLKTADRPTRHRNLTSWHQRFLLAALGSLNALGLQGSRWRPRPAGRLWERRHAPARSACKVSAGALILQGSRWHTRPAGFAPTQRRVRARPRRRSCASSAASIPSARQLPAPG